MAANALKINFSEIDNVKAELATASEEFEALVNKTFNTSEVLKYWQGTDAHKYTTAIQQKCTDLKKLCETITEINNFLETVKNAYNSAMEANANAIKY